MTIQGNATPARSKNIYEDVSKWEIMIKIIRVSCVLVLTGMTTMTVHSQGTGGYVEPSAAVVRQERLG
jgi:hypothetical protein